MVHGYDAALPNSQAHQIPSTIDNNMDSSDITPEEIADIDQAQLDNFNKTITFKLTPEQTDSILRATQTAFRPTLIQHSQDINTTDSIYKIDPYYDNYLFTEKLMSILYVLHRNLQIRFHIRKLITDRYAVVLIRYKPYDNKHAMRGHIMTTIKKYKDMRQKFLPFHIPKRDVIVIGRRSKSMLNSY